MYEEADFRQSAESWCSLMRGNDLVLLTGKGEEESKGTGLVLVGKRE